MRTTITMNDTIFKSLRLQAAETDESVSKLIEDAVKYQVLEDFEDIKDADARMKEPSYSFDDLVKQLKSEKLI